MDMKGHILAALLEKFDDWEKLISNLSESQRSSPLAPSEWSIKDHLAHLMAWQQRSIARVEAALQEREPQFPEWADGLDPEDVGNTEPVNGWIYANYRDQTWNQVYQSWREGFLRFLEGSKAISERDLLDSGRYAWLGGYPLASILLGSYDHHQEHYEILLAWLRG